MVPPRWEERDVLTAAGPVRARVGPRDRLPAGSRLAGPLILTQEDSTTWIPPGWDMEIDPLGNLLMTRRAEAH